MRFFAAVLFFSAGLAFSQTYDVAINNGRVMDPESGLDATRSLGISGGKVRAISDKPLTARTVIDAKGLVVSPGFIDLHWHGRNPATYRYCAMQGVTAALELEIGDADMDSWYSERAGKSMINFGASAGHPRIRMAVMHDPGDFLPAGDAANRAATAEEITEMRRRLEAQLKAGAPAVGFGAAYTQAASYREILDMFTIAARYKASCHIHVRGASSNGGQVELGISEAIAAAFLTGAPLHIVHINSSSGPALESGIQMIEAARARGLDITTEAYPYTAGATRIESALFNNWKTQPDSWFTRFQWVATGERLTRATFEKYHQQGGIVIIHANTPERVDRAITSPLTMIASDGFDLDGGQGHPRSSGCFARILSRYVREQKSITLMDAIRKMSLMPAQRLETRVPMMKDKGRIRLGADADIAVFDPARVRDRSTYENPAVEAEGFVHVLVNGVPVVRDGKAIPDAKPGQSIRAAKSL